MTINLKDAVFENDLFTVELPNGGSLIFNCINEIVQEKAVTKEKEETVLKEVKGFNIQAVTEIEGNTYYYNCINVIGMKDDIIEIKTDYTQYRGSLLTLDNMEYCTVEVSGNE